MKKRMFVDKSICTGCRYCEGVCYLVHSSSNHVNPRRTRIVVHQDIANGSFAPVVCKQCVKPVCVEACQLDAMPIDHQLGTPIIDAEKCNGCMACLEACPFDAIFFDSEQRDAIMCDMCGGDPKCVKFCRALHQSYSALAYTTPDEWSKRKARQFRSA